MSGIQVHAVGPERWADLETLFGPSGAYSGCWCMWWRISGREFADNGNAGNKKALQAVVKSGEPVGLLAYRADEPVGWMALAPQAAYPRLLRSPMKPEVDAGTWSVTCFFIPRKHRREGVATVLLKAAAKHAKAGGASTLEAYPVDTSDGTRRDAAALYTGTVNLFERAGFGIHRHPPSGKRVIMRRGL